MGKEESASKSSPAMTRELSDHDVTHVGRIMGGYGDWFSAQLLRLVAKADNGNREKLRKGFPETVALYEAWYRGRNYERPS